MGTANMDKPGFRLSLVVRRRLIKGIDAEGGDNDFREGMGKAVLVKSLEQLALCGLGNSKEQGDSGKMVEVSMAQVGWTGSVG